MFNHTQRDIFLYGTAVLWYAYRSTKNGHTLLVRLQTFNCVQFRERERECVCVCVLVGAFMFVCVLVSVCALAYMLCVCV